MAYEHKEAWIPAFGSILRLFCLHSVGFWFYVYERSGIESKDCGLTKLNWCFTVQEPRACKTHGKNIHLHHWIVLPNAAEYNLIFTVSRTKSIGRYSSQWVSHYIQWTTIFFHMCSVVSAPCHHVVHLSHMFHIGSIFPYVLHIYIYICIIYIYVGYICIYVGYICIYVGYIYIYMVFHVFPKNNSNDSLIRSASSPPSEFSKGSSPLWDLRLVAFARTARGARGAAAVHVDP